MNMTVTMNLSGQDDAINFCLTGNIVDLISIVTALQEADPNRMPPSYAKLAYNLKKLLDSLCALDK